MKKTLVAILYLISATSFAQSISPTAFLGITLPSGCTIIEKNRCQSSRSYADTKKDMHARLSKLKNLRIEEINLPHVRATSYINNDKNSFFLAVNIYLNVQSGLTEIFFVEHAPRDK